jgi:glycosyltransferase involved in cell wall biosynthesis
MTKIACAAVVKNEARYLAEWLAWQFMLGFDAVVLLDNGSTDETLAIAECFAAAYDVRRFHWADTSRRYQADGFETVARTLAGEFEWVAFFDAGGFSQLENLKHVDHTVKERYSKSKALMPKFCLLY